MTDDWAGRLQAVFAGFRSKERKSASAFPDHDGVVIRAPEAYLSFRGMVRLSELADTDDAPSLRNDVDRLCSLGVMHRGLILRCAACKDLAFITLDDVQSTNTCRRCGAANQLTHERWNHPMYEPTWWYDLHPAERGLLGADAGVGILAAHHLRHSARRYDYPGHPWRRGDHALAAMLNEVSHHGTQICMVRDIYANRYGRTRQR